MAKGIQFFTGGKVVDNPTDVYQSYTSKLKQIQDIEKRDNFIRECVDKIKNENLDNYGLSNSDKSEITKALKDLAKQNEGDKKKVISKILTEIEKLKNNK